VLLSLSHIRPNHAENVCVDFVYNSIVTHCYFPSRVKLQSVDMSELSSPTIVGWLNEIFVTWRTKAPNLAQGSLGAHLLMLA